MLRRIAVTLAIAFLVVVAAGAIASNSVAHGVLWVNIVRWFIVALAIPALTWLVFGTTDVETPEGTGQPLPQPPTLNEIALAYYNVSEMYDRQALKLLVNMMVDRPNYLERINENVSLEDETPELKVVTRQIFRVRAPSSALIEADPADEGLVSRVQHLVSRVQHEGSATATSKQSHVSEKEHHELILVPLVLVEKGTLLDGFTVTDASGNGVPTLSYNQSRGLLVHLIENIISMVPEEVTSYRDPDRKDTIETVRANLVTAVCAPRRMNKKDSDEQTRIKRLLDSTDRLPFTNEWKKRIRDFCEVFVNYYVIVAEVILPVGGHVILTYSQQVSVDSSARGLVNRVRSRLGLRFSAFDIPLNIFALEVEAYHMEMAAAPMQYVFDHHLERMNSKILLTQRDLERSADRPYVRLHYNSAGPIAHLYIRRQRIDETEADIPQSKGSSSATNYASVPTERLKSVIEFREIPPGALGASAVISLITAVIITFFALTQIGQERPASHLPVIIGSDIPALIIALPGIASIVVGSWLDLSHLRRASLSTYVGLGASLALSIASALYFLLGASEPILGHLSLGVTSHVIIKTNVGWLVLAGMAVTFSLFLVRDVVSNSRYYSNQVKERLKRHM
jgi:hypothetical protein